MRQLKKDIESIYEKINLKIIIGEKIDLSYTLCLNSFDKVILDTRILDELLPKEKPEYLSYYS